MQIEIRAGTAHISGYVNVTEKKSRPVITPYGKVVEEIEPRAFERALERAVDIPLTVDHDGGKIYASTGAGTMKLHEDMIGLYADVQIEDRALVESARTGAIKGWSFGMYNIKDELEERADALPLRRIKDLDLDHLTLVIKKTPCYSATSLELRADGEAVVETRTVEVIPKITAEPLFDNSKYRQRVEAVKQKGEQEK